jgi:hypothetical protein
MEVPPYIWTTSNLPAELQLAATGDTSTASLSAVTTFTTAGTYAFSINVENSAVESCSTGTLWYSIEVTG